MHILIIKTSSLGDVIHMLPAITDATQSLSDLRIDWLVEDSFAAIPQWHTGVNKVIPIAMRRWRKHLIDRKTWQEMADARASIQTTNYDLVIDSQGLIKSAIWCRMSSGIRVGYDRKSSREPLASCFYERKLNVHRQQHAIQRNRQFLAQALGYKLENLTPDYGLNQLITRLPAVDVTLPTRYIIGLHGTSRANKLWPTMHWKTLAQRLEQTQHCLVLPWGNDEERIRAQHIAMHASNVIVLPKLGLNALARLIYQADAVVGVDTGLLHLAAALGKPLVALYTATPPELTGAVLDRNSRHTMHNLSAPQDLSAAAVLDTLMTTLIKR